MKQFLIVILICTTQSIFSQSEEIKRVPYDLRDNLENYKSEEIIYDENQIYNTAGLEILPTFPGGSESFQRFIKENYKIPQVTGLKGKIYMTFVIEKDGSLSDIKSIRDLKHGTGEEAIRVLKTAPKWIPGKQNGELVRVLYSIPISINQ
jgi:protein TonB